MWLTTSLTARLALAEALLLVDFLIVRFYLTQPAVEFGVAGINQRLLKAAADNAVHFSVAGASWFVATYPYSSRTQVLVCALLASLIDVDHFVAAGSLVLAAATSLPRRPFLHNSALLAITNVAFVAALVLARHSRPVKWLLRRLTTEHVTAGGARKALAVGLLVATAWLTHHLNDAVRRGLWLGDGLGSTAALPVGLYLCLVLGLPLALRWLFYTRLVGNYGQLVIRASSYEAAEETV